MPRARTSRQQCSPSRRFGARLTENPRRKLLWYLRGSSMWSRNSRGALSSFSRLAAAIAIAGLAAGCFQPLYGDRTVTGGSALRTALAAVDVAQIDAANG